MKNLEMLRKKFLKGLLYHDRNGNHDWVKTANMREVDGIAYIQTDGHENIFPKGKWEDIESLISLL